MIVMRDRVHVRTTGEPALDLDVLAIALGLGELDWQGEALCAQVDSEIFYPERGQPGGPAKAVCAVCPVRAECLEYALERHERHGIWGGTSERERERMWGSKRGEGSRSAA